MWGIFMHYTIKEVSEITGLPSSTLRYYETEQ
ncbi:MerR family DNA-binding transcriptional regulator [Anoxybacillus rupiensis]|nr:MerR family DNA-binding transcriptional regulator [Anoxybacillus rupiensis]